jgi:hypothetical protein
MMFHHRRRNGRTSSIGDKSQRAGKAPAGAPLHRIQLLVRQREFLPQPRKLLVLERQQIG